ncbi:MAG: 50S ribosomal protein L11 methyltransferase [Acidimicrobiales bacterium]
MVDDPRSWTVEVVVTADAMDEIELALWDHEPTALLEAPAAPGAITLTAGFASENAAVLATSALQDHASVLELAMAEADNPDDWTTHWRRGAEPHRVGDFFVRLDHHAPDPSAIDLVVEPEVAFGYSHPSTQLLLRTMTPELLDGASVADVGTGSGILAIAADLGGAALVDAVDTDPNALAVAKTNTLRNSSTVNLIEGSASDLPHPDYDLIVANLTAGALVAIARDLEARVRRGGVIAISGVLDGQLESVLDAFQSSPKVIELLDGWVATTLCQTAPGSR